MTPYGRQASEQEVVWLAVCRASRKRGEQSSRDACAVPMQKLVHGVSRSERAAATVREDRCGLLANAASVTD